MDARRGKYRIQIYSAVTPSFQIRQLLTNAIRVAAVKGGTARTGVSGSSLFTHDVVTGSMVVIHLILPGFTRLAAGKTIREDLIKI